MARPSKNGLDYFPFDTDFFCDEKIVCVAGEHGDIGWIVALKLLVAIYRNGYWLKWTEAVRFKMLLENGGLSGEKLDAIIGSLLKWGFFDRGLFEKEGVLTSRGIQRRYFSIARRRKEADRPFLLIKDKSDRADKSDSSDKSDNSDQPTAAEVTVHFRAQNAPRRLRDWESAARLFYDTFAASGWINKYGRPVADWRSEANRWIYYQEQRDKKQNNNGNNSHPTARNDLTGENRWINGKIVPACGLIEE